MRIQNLIHVKRLRVNSVQHILVKLLLRILYLEQMQVKFESGGGSRNWI